MKRKTIELKEFDYKTPYQLDMMMCNPCYNGMLVVEDKYGCIFQARLHKFEDGSFQFLRAGDDADTGIETADVVLIEDKGLM